MTKEFKHESKTIDLQKFTCMTFDKNPRAVRTGHFHRRFQGRNQLKMIEMIEKVSGAAKRTRTSTPVTGLAPQASASTNSAMAAW